MHLIHFESKDLGILHRQGRFWHCFLSGGGVLVSQDEDNTWTLNNPTPLDTDITKLGLEKIISRSISGSFEVDVPIKIDKIFVSSLWRPNIHLAAHYTSLHQRIFLAGDSAHQTVPAGGYGMNTAVGDCFDIGWKLSAVLKGYAETKLLSSYESERRPVAECNLDQARKNWYVHGEWWSMVQETGRLIYEQSKEGRKLRDRIRHHLETHDLENRAFGIELDYRYKDSPVIVRDETDLEPDWHAAHYTPSTWPGARVPSVQLEDGKRNIYELLGQGPEFTIVDFTGGGSYAQAFVSAGRALDVPLRAVHLPDETHVRDVWERDAVLVRPDDHVAWRSGPFVSGNDMIAEAAFILSKALGRDV